MISDIPPELFNNILYRVPAESLLRLRGVCNLWRRRIDDPVFIKSHIDHQLSSPILGHLLIRKQTGKLSSFSLDSLDLDYSGSPIQTRIEGTIVMNLYPPFHLPVLPVASCNGLILLMPHYCEHIHNMWVLWNPLTQEFRPLPEICPISPNEAIGFGYDCVNDDYKVVRIDGISNSELQKTLVYSTKSNLWKFIPNCHFGFPLCKSPGIYVNGTLYWMMSSSSIIALDLSTEEYRQVDLPFDVSRIENAGWDVDLDGLGGLLSLRCNYWDIFLHVWVMNDDGGGNISWTKLFSFNDFGDIAMKNQLRPIACSEGYGHALVWDGRKLVWLDVNNNCVKQIIHISGFNDTFSCLVWKPSLFRFKNNVLVQREQDD